MNWSVPIKHYPGTLCKGPRKPTEECRQEKGELCQRKAGQQLVFSTVWGIDVSHKEVPDSDCRKAPCLNHHGLGIRGVPWKC